MKWYIKSVFKARVIHKYGYYLVILKTVLCKFILITSYLNKFASFDAIKFNKDILLLIIYPCAEA